VPYNKLFTDFDSLTLLMGELQRVSLFGQGQISELSPEKITNKLYHYTSVQGLEGIATNANLWATDYRFLNDSREMKDGVEIIHKELALRGEVVLKELAKFLVEHADSSAEIITPYIISFCSQHDLLSQWRAYASQSEGYCVEFDFSDSRLSACKGDTAIMCHLLPVIYDDDIKIKVVKSIIDELLVVLKKHRIDNAYIADSGVEKTGMIIGLLFNVFQLPLLTFKDKGFAEEKEWRAVFLLNSVQNDKLRKFRTSGGAFTPYVEGTFIQGDKCRLFQREVLPIKSICLPPAAGKAARKGVELFLQGSGFTGGYEIPVNDSAIPLRNQKNINW
jgi:hypothetical protein